MKTEVIRIAASAEVPSAPRTLDERKRALLAALFQKNGIANEASLIRKRAAQDTLPVSFAQQRLWFLDQMDPGSPVYNIRAAIRLRGALDTQALNTGIENIWKRHEALRAVFHNNNGAVEQTLLPADWSGLRKIDVSAFASPLERAVEMADADTRLPFELDQGPLFRPLLVRAGALDHILALTFHHIVADAWSVGIFLRELASFYRAAIDRNQPDLPPLQVQYADFAAWQQDWLQTPQARSQVDYWKRTVTSVVPLELPLDRVRPRLQSTAGGDYSFALDRELTRAVYTCAREYGVTNFVVLMAAFQATIFRYSGQVDFAVGSTVAGRTRLEVESLIGLFMNVLPVRSAVDPDASFALLMTRIHNAVLECHQNQDLPFDRLVEELRLPRDLARHPIFQVLLTFHNTPQNKPQFGGLELSSVPLTNTVARFDMGIDVTESAGQFQMRFEYADLFDRSSIERFASSFRQLLETAVTAPNTPISLLPQISDLQRQRLIAASANTTAQPWEGLCVHQVFEQNAALAGNRLAAVHGSDQVSYRELDERANAIAEQLCALGSGPDTLVGVAMPRGIDMLAALLGVMKSGAAYVPIDPDFPISRLEFIISDSQLSVLISEEETAAKLPSFSGKLLLLDPTCPLQTARRISRPTPAGSAPAYVIYTSGSTGKPKGVAIPHSAVTNFLFSISREPGMESKDVILATTTLSFDIAVLELFLPLAVGGSVVIASRETAIDPVLLAREIENRKVTMLQATPATWQMLVDSGVRWNSQLRALCGGEALKRDLANEILDRCSRLWNMYGPTEATVWSAVSEVKRDGKPIVLGSPIANTNLHILDTHLNPVPEGVVGELFIGGAGLAIGYLNQPELTAEKFIAHPFDSNPGTRIYRTGDLARRRLDGGIEFLGRADSQVKIRGYRIEAGEVEAALCKHSSVLAAVVDAREDDHDEKRLVAWIVSGKEAPSISELRQHLAATLPDYMIPSAFVFVDHLPMTPNGKVDRRALSVPPSQFDTAPTRQYFAPENSTEEKVALIWRELLGIRQVDRNDNFFELGGHSLLLARVHARIRAEIDPNITMTELFRYPTVAALAERLSSGETGQATASSRAHARAGIRLDSMRRHLQTR